MGSGFTFAAAALAVGPGNTATVPTAPSTVDHSGKYLPEVHQDRGTSCKLEKA
jgi:hypothetical protein